MEYEVILVTKDQGHMLSKYVQDDEDLFVVGDDGSWTLASDFFHVKGEMKFKVL
jgi:hypothetical protein